MVEESVERISGLIFVSLMFIGAGIGLLFGRPDVGGALGMGLGFLAMAFLKYRGVKIVSEKTISLKGFIGSIILASIGLLFILAGVTLLFNLEFLIKYFAGIILIAIGLIFISLGFKILGG